MSTIHGRSTRAIRFFRKKPAALSAYWLYCAHRNHEGVAWLSLPGLVRESEWSINPCKDARDWLVEHGALEPVPDYIRPGWRELDPKVLKRRLNLDQSEYFRVTGRLVIDGKTYSLLYAPGDDAPEELPAPDLSRRDKSSGDKSPAEDRTQTPVITPRNIVPCDVAPHDISLGDNDLDSIKELDSIKDELDTSSRNLDARAGEDDKSQRTTAAATADPDQPTLEVFVVKEPSAAPAAGESPSPGSAAPSPQAAAIAQADVDAWGATYHQLELQLDRSSFNTWLAGARLLAVEGDTFVIGVRNDYARDMLTHRVYRTVGRLLRDISGRTLELRFEVNTAPVAPVDDVVEEMPLFQRLAQQDAAAAIAAWRRATDAEIGEIMTLYIDNIDKDIAPLAVDDLTDLTHTCGAAAMRYAIQQAVDHNKRNLAYIRAIAQRVAGTHS